MSCRVSPVGIFDSGLGGLTVYKAVRELLPSEKLIYFGDTARVPYGTKSRESVISFSKEIAGYLILKKVKMVVIACNTATSLALPEIRRMAQVPVCGVIEPGVKAALAATPPGGRILVIGTNATVASHAYEKALHRINPSVEVMEQACPLFVPLVEEGWTDKSVTEDAALEYLSPYLSKKINTLILGCTHYPMLEKVVRNIMGSKVHIVNSALATAYAVRQILEKETLLAPQRCRGTDRFIVSDSPGHFSVMANRLLGLSPQKVMVKRF